MDFHVKKLKEIGWNERVLTEEDFDLCCQDEGVLVYNVKMPLDGLYGVIEDVPVILLNEQLRGVKRLEVAWHELGHHFFDSPAFCAFSKDTARKAQHKAQIIAVCALIPKPMLKEMMRWHPAELSDYSENLLKFRLEVFRNYKI